MKTKRTKHVLLALFIFIAINLKAQTKGIIYYKVTIDNKDNNLRWTENHAIYFLSNKSIELILPKLTNETKVQTGPNDITKNVLFKAKSSKPLFIYKDFENKALRLSENIEFKKYLITDTLDNFSWKITDVHQKILKFNCTKATTSFRGRNYVAWFTEDIPIRNGPWKFSNLPGLIVKAYDDDNRYIFELEALDLKTPFDSEIIAIPSAYANDTPISHQSFIERYSKKVKELEAQSKASVQIYNKGSGFTTFSIPPIMEKY